jgi:hypothetical protein
MEPDTLATLICYVIYRLGTNISCWYHCDVKARRFICARSCWRVWGLLPEKFFVSYVAYEA